MNPFPILRKSFMTSKSINIAISIPLEMYRWLEKPENKKRINRSRVFQDVISNLMNPPAKKMHPMSILVMIMGMSFGVGSIIMSATGVFDFMMSTTFLLLGAVVLLASIVTMIRETRSSNARHVVRG